MSEDENYADLVKKAFEPLNNNDKFKEKFKDEQFKILLNPKDDEYASLIIVDKGTVSVEKIANKPKENISKKVLGWDGLVQTTKQLFDDIAAGKLSTRDIVKKITTRKIKVKNLKLLPKLAEMQALLIEE